ncbi:MAG: hypothetical protein KQ78_01869 [Candidatus Izimaplasma bacterium HR2]|nr:MAG: hypothetical protein KQ78_01869 [Candidatus Izimaplasma bacterium HR2]
MLKAINYFKQKTNLIDSFGITTNGTIVDTNLLQILKENKNVYIGISLDGTKNMNQFRVFKNTKDNSYDKVIESIEVLKENGFIDRISIHIVTHLYNVYLLHHGIKHLQSLGIKRIGVGTIEKTMEIDDMYVKTFVSEFKKISKDIAKGIITVHIDLLDYLKPKSDVRHYIYDKGKIVGESYGRAKDDITNNKNNFNIIAPGSPFSDMIYNLRETVYNNHKQILLKEQKRKEFYKLCNIIKGKTS